VIEIGHGVDPSRAGNPELLAVREQIAYRIFRRELHTHLAQFLPPVVEVQLEDRVLHGDVDGVFGQDTAAERVVDVLFPD